MAVKSLEDLKKIREEHMKKVKLRETGESDDNVVEILVGMATCGIAAGAREVLNAFVKEISERSLDHIKVVQVGCMGYCHSEPTIQVSKPGNEPIIYGNVSSGDVVEIIERTILGDELLDNKIINKLHNHA